MSNTSNQPWAWLGLLKWSLSYSDGTKDEPPAPMSPEDRAFLEKVMKEGIIDEGERMKTILEKVTVQMEEWKNTEGNSSQEEEDTVHDLLEELRDIVEQIDYARAFMAMSGLPFLIGCACQRESIPRTVRQLALGIIATMCQNNPPVQQQLLELGALKDLTELFVAEEETDASGSMRAKIVQAISATVRSHEMAESVFCQLEQASELFERALGSGSPLPPVTLTKRILFFLRALLTSDVSTQARVRQFQRFTCWTMDRLLLADEASDVSIELSEMALDLIQELLRQKKSVNAILTRREALVAKGVARVAKLREQKDDTTAIELDLWESVLQLLARAEPDMEEVPAAPLLLGSSGPAPNKTTAAQ